MDTNALYKFCKYFFADKMGREELYLCGTLVDPRREEGGGGGAWWLLTPFPSNKLEELPRRGNLVLSNTWEI